MPVDLDGLSRRSERDQEFAADMHQRTNYFSPSPRQLNAAGSTRLLALACALATVTDSALRMLVQLYLEKLGASPLVIGLGTTLAWLGAFVGGALWGNLSERSRPRPFLIGILLATSALAAALAWISTSPGVLVFVFLRVFAVTGYMPIALAIVARQTSVENRGRQISVVGSSREFGYALGLVIAGFAVAGAGFRYSFAILSVPPLLGAVLLFRLLSTTPTSQESKERAPIRRPSRGLGALYVAATLRQVANAGATSLTYIYMATLHIAPGTMGLVTATSPAIQVGAMLLFGRLADRVGRRAIILTGFALSAVVPLVFAVARNVFEMTLGYVVLGIAFPAVFVGAAALISDTASPGRQASALGAFDSSRALGGVLGPLAAGALVPLLGLRGMFFVMAGIAAIAFLVSLAVTGQWRGKRGSRDTRLVTSEERISADLP